MNLSKRQRAILRELAEKPKWERVVKHRDVYLRLVKDGYVRAQEGFFMLTVKGMHHYQTWLQSAYRR